MTSTATADLRTTICNRGRAIGCHPATPHDSRYIDLDGTVYLVVGKTIANLGDRADFDFRVSIGEYRFRAL